MRLTNRAVMIGMGVVIVVSYWAVYVPHNWDRWSVFRRGRAVTNALVLLACVILGAVIAFRKWREGRDNDKPSDR